MKKTLKLTGDKMQRKAKNAMAENSFLVNECNMLRRENHQLRQKVGQMETTLQLSAKPLMRSQSATTTAASSFDPRNQPGWSQGHSGRAFASDEKKQPEGLLRNYKTSSNTEEFDSMRRVKQANSSSKQRRRV